LTFEDARRLAQRAVGDYVLDLNHVIERPWGWMFCVTGRTSIRRGSIEDMLVGCGPIAVDRDDGSVHTYSSSAPPAHWADVHGHRRAWRSRWRALRAAWRRALAGKP
jgi:hypothetical protein